MIKIVADTTSCIPTDRAAKLGIGYIPQIIIFGDNSFRDDTEMDSEAFLKKLRESPTLPKTAAPPPLLYQPIYQEFSQPGNTLFVICPSAEVSGTVRSATVAAQEFSDADIRIIDTRTIGSGLGSIVLQTVDWANQGLPADMVEAKLRDMISREHVFFMVDTLEYLYKGGRIGGAQMLFGSLLQVKPILTVKNGRTEPVESQRTHKRALERVKQMVYSDCPHGPDACLTIMHGDAIDEATKLAEELKENLGLSKVPTYQLPPAIMVHAGPGTLAISYFIK
jgi:DegV family protein with EDD domain